MAKIERVLKCDFYMLLHDIDDGIRNGNISATLEEETEYDIPGGKAVFKVYERYSFFGGNRVSLAVLAIKQGDITKLCAVSSGGSRGFIKINTLSESAFIEKLSKIIEKYEACDG